MIEDVFAVPEEAYKKKRFHFHGSNISLHNGDKCPKKWCRGRVKLMGFYRRYYYIYKTFYCEKCDEWHEVCTVLE